MIFCSNRDPIFGDKIVGNVDELWSSSKDVTTSPLGPTPLPGDSSDLALRAPSTSSDRSEIRAQYMQSFISGDDKLNEITSHTPEDVQASIDTSEHSGGKSKLLVKEKVQRIKYVILFSSSFLLCCGCKSLVQVSSASELLVIEISIHF